MESKDRVIRLTDLIAMLLKGLIVIVCVAILFALFGAVKSYKGQMGDNLENSVTQDELNRAKAAYTEAEIIYSTAESSLKNVKEVQIPALLDYIAWAKESSLALREHLNKSLLMDLDPYACPEASMSFYINSEKIPAIAFQESQPYVYQDDEMPSYAVKWPLDTAALEQVRSILNIDADLQYVEELTSITYNQSGLAEIKVYCSDTQAAKEAVDFLFKTVRAQLNSTLKTYTITEVGRFCGVTVDQDLINRQGEFARGLNDLTSTISESEKTLNELKSDINGRKTALEEASTLYHKAKQNLYSAEKAMANPNVRGGVSRRAMLRKAILTGFIGAVISAVGVICVGIFGKTLQNHTEVSLRYPYPLIGVLPRQRKYLFEKLIRKLEGESDLDFDSAAHAVAQSLSAVIGERHVALVSTLGSKEAEKLMPYLDERVKVCGDILSDADAIKSLPAFDGLVLIERRGKSNIDIIDSEVLRAKTLGKEIVGVILT